MTEFYPLKFNALLIEKIWGGNKLHHILSKKANPEKPIGESWDISGVENMETEVANGYLAENTLSELAEIYMHDFLGRKVYDTYGVNFPLLCKFIDAADVLSVQVHPDDEMAKKHHGLPGKNEMWYIVEAEENAKIYVGFDKNISPQEFSAAVKEGTTDSLMRTYYPKAGDVFNIPAGTIHAIGKGVLLAEIQQTSDLTYRIFDWNRTDNQGNSRELHIDLAMEALNYNTSEHVFIQYNTIPNTVIPLVSNKYFNVSILHANRPIELDYYHIDSFIIYMIVDGEATFEYNTQEKVTAKKGESILLPAELSNFSIIPSEKASLLEAYIL